MMTSESVVSRNHDRSEFSLSSTQTSSGTDASSSVLPAAFVKLSVREARGRIVRDPTGNLIMRAPHRIIITAVNNQEPSKEKAVTEKQPSSSCLTPIKNLFDKICRKCMSVFFLNYFRLRFFFH
jgi:hypothetical protein